MPWIGSRVQTYGQRGGPAHREIEQPKGGPIYNSQKDPLGIGLMGRAMEQRQGVETAESTSDPFFRGFHNTLPDARWEGLKQALFEAGVDRLRGGNAPGSNQLVGVTAQPHYFKSDQQFVNPRTGQQMWNRDYQGTMFSPGQKSAVTGRTFEEDEAYQNALRNRMTSKSLRGLRGAI